jgi:hypothetical protein
VTYRLLSEDESPLDAYFSVDGTTLVFHGSNVTAGTNESDVDYVRGLELLIQRLIDAGNPVQRGWLDGNRVQALSIADRVILDDNDIKVSSADQVSRMVLRMQSFVFFPDVKSNQSKATQRIRLQVMADISGPTIRSAIRAIQVEKDFRSEERLPVSELERVRPEHLFRATERLLNGAEHNFGESTDYDVLLEDNSRLAPKALFGLAASEALGFSVKPRHFVGGQDSTCFRVLTCAGYRIVSKSETPGKPSDVEHGDPEWFEGTPMLRQHLRRERAVRLREAKKSDFRKHHDGELFCERCGEDPVRKYGTEDADACIEVHHASVQVSEMQPGHRTRLADLQCLCANCHRLIHREMRRADAGETVGG